MAIRWGVERLVDREQLLVLLDGFGEPLGSPVEVTESAALERDASVRGSVTR